MCGIAGFFELSAPPESYPQLIRSMLAPISHRGPDAVGYFVDDRAAIGTTRLAIIDIATGHQPMGSSDRRFWLTFNGEIFNYIELRAELESRAAVCFRTSSDTEVLLQALIVWGASALPKLEGQFAFLFLDRLGRRLLFARDRLGERPLFFTQAHGGFVFGSEIKALFGLPGVRRALNAEAIQQVGQFWVNLPGETCFAGVRSLRPGHFGVIETGRLTLKAYSRLPIGEMRPVGRQEAQGEIVRRLEHSARLRLRSDVPVGVYLSGGLDSTITTALALNVGGGRPTSFSVAFEDEAFNESRYQAEAVDYFGIDNVTVRVTNDDIAEHFPRAVWHAETVLFRTAPVPLLLLARAVREHGIKVVLTGEGADEVFLGYEIFREAVFRTEFASLSEDERLDRLRRLYPYLDRYRGGDVRMLLAYYAGHLAERTPGLFSHEPRFSGGAHFGRLFDAPADVQAGNERLAAMLLDEYPTFSGLSMLAKAQLIEFETLLAGYLLSSQGDRMTSAYGVEGRYPFLGSPVVAYGLSIPEELRLTGSLIEKRVLSDAFAGRIPAGIAARGKQPYRAPGLSCFAGPHASERVRMLLGEGSIKDIGFLHEGRVRQFLGRVTRPAHVMSQRDEVAFVALLSVAELHEALIRQPAASRFPEELLTVAADERPGWAGASVVERQDRV